MRFYLSEIKAGRPTLREDDIVYGPERFQDKGALLGLKDIHVQAKAYQANNRYVIDVIITGTMVLACAYTLEALERPLKMNETLIFSDEVTEDDAVLPVTGTAIVLDDYLLGLILTEVPTKVVKKGARLPKAGKGYRVLTEAEHAREKAQKGDPRMAALDDFEE